MTKRQALKRILAGALAFIALCFIVAFLLLRSRTFHRYVLAQMTERAEKATHSRVQIGDFTFQLSGLRLDLYRIAIQGAGRNSGQLLLWVDHAGINLKIVSLLERKIDLASVVIDHPVVHLVMDASGKSNLPHPAVSSEPSEPGDIFNLAVGHLRVNRGYVNFNDRQIPLKAELRHLQVEAAFNAARKEYGGSLDYRTGDIQFGAFQPLQHSLNVSFIAGPDGMRFNPLVVSAGASKIAVVATVRNYAHPLVKGFYSIEFSASQIARLMNSAAVPAGAVATQGSFSYQNVSGRALLDSVSLDGRISGTGLTFHFRGMQSHLAAVSGAYHLERGDFAAHAIEARFAGGQVRGDLAIQHVSGNARGTLALVVQSLSLRSLRRTLPHSRWARFPVSGRLDATAEATWHGSFAGLHVRSGAVIRASVAPGQPTNGNEPIPVQGVIHATYDASMSVLTLSQTVLRTPASEVDLNGTLGTHAALAVSAQSHDLRETDLLITNVHQFASNTPSYPIRAMGLAGSASFQGFLQGRLQSPTLAGKLLATPLKVRGIVFTRIQALVRLRSSGVSVSDGQVQTAQGRAQFQASLGLRHWAYNPSAPIALQVTANNLPVAAVESLTNRQYPISGTLSAWISIHGSVLHPAGAGTIEVVKADAWKQPIRKITAHFQGAGNTLQSAIAIETSAGNANVNVTYNPETQAFSGAMSLTSVRLQKLEALQKRRLQVVGAVTASLRGQGTLKSPNLQGKLSIPSLRAGQEAITAVSAHVTVAGRIATVTLVSYFSGAPVHATGTVNLTGAYEANVTLNTGGLDLGPLLTAYAPGAAGNLHCQAEVHASLRGPLKERQRLQAEIDIPMFRLAYRTLQIASVAPISLAAQSGSIVLKTAELKGSGTDFRVQGTAPLWGDGSVRASMTGIIDLHLLRMLYPDWDSTGQVQLNINASGNRSHPTVQGQVRVLSASVEPPNGPIGVQDLNATLMLTANRAEITSLIARVGGGSISGSGFLSYNHGMQFNLALRAHNVRIRYPAGVREVLDSNLRMTGAGQAILISGQVSLNRLSLTQSFDLGNFANRFNVVSLPVQANGFTSRVRLNVAVRSAHQLALGSSQLNLRGAADLRVQGTLANPVVVGRATLNSGELFFNGSRYRVESGMIDFVNPVMTEPVVNIRVSTTVSQYALTVNFTGPFDRLRTTYTSDPPLPPVDIVSLLMTGQTGQAQNTGLGAQSLLTQGLSSQFSTRVQKLTGISSLTIDPQMGNQGTNPGARIAVQERVTKNLYFTFSVDVVTTQDDVVQLEYNLSHTWSVEAIRDEAGDYSLEVKAHKTF